MRRAIPVSFLLLAACVHSEPPEPALIPSEVAWDAPPSARSWYLRGSDALRRDDFEEAARAFRWVTRLDGQEPEGWAGLARAELELGRPEEALAAAERAVELGSADGDAALIAAQAATTMALPDAGELWEQALEAGGAQAWVGWVAQQPEVQPALRRWVASQRDGGEVRRLLAEQHSMPEIAVLDGLLEAERRGASVVPHLDAAVAHCRVGSVVAWGLDRRVARWSNLEVSERWARLEALAGPEPAGPCLVRAKAWLDVEGCVPAVDWWWAMEAAPGWVQRQPKRSCTD